MFGISAKIKERQVIKTNKMVNDLLELTNKQVLVGVPEEKDPRYIGKGKKKVLLVESVGNATLAYIHDNGSPLQNIPARPFMDPGIKQAQDRILPEFMKIAQDQLSDKKDKIEARFNRIGMICQASIRNVINEGEGFTPLKRSTLLGRLRRRKAARKWTDERREEVMESFKPLVDSGQLRNSITYVVAEKS